MRDANGIVRSLTPPSCHAFSCIPWEWSADGGGIGAPSTARGGPSPTPAPTRRIGAEVDLDCLGIGSETALIYLLSCADNTLEHQM